MPVIIKDGDLFTTTANIIGHQVNCKGAMNSGVARQVREKYPAAYSAYKTQCSDKKNLLGTIQIVSQPDGHIICNMFAQSTYGYDGRQYTDISALRNCLIALKRYALTRHLSVALPYNIGCCRGGADWSTVFSMIKSIFSDSDVTVELWKYDKGE